MRLTKPSAQEVIARIPWWQVALFISMFTISFAGAYFALSAHSPMNGILDASNKHISFGTCLYFSIVTESTLGDGNITPRGISRAFVSAQVLVGLIIFGMLVAKIVSARSATLVKLSQMSEGDWVDCVKDHEGNMILGRTWIQGEQNGLRFQGTDFYGSGKRAGSFISHSIAISIDKANFTFQSFDFTKKIFNQGVSTLKFSNVQNGVYTAYSVTITDSAGLAFSGSGIRLDVTPFRLSLKERENSLEDTMKKLAGYFRDVYKDGEVDSHAWD